MAMDGYGYELPGDAPEAGQAASVPLRLDFTENPMQGRIAHLDNDASTLQHQFSQTDGFSLSSSYSNRLLDPFSGDGEADMDGFWDLRLSTPQAGLLPGIKMDFSVGGFDGDNGSDFGDSAHQRIKIKTSNKFGFLDYGTSYKLVGQDYAVVDKKHKVNEKERDRLTTNSWIGKSFGNLYVTQFMEQTHSNIESSSKPEITDSLFGTSLRYTLLNWPYVGSSISYASGNRESDAGLDLGITSLNGGISASHNTWNLDLYVSETSPESSAGDYFGQPKDTNYYLGGSYYPSKTLVITPSINHNTLSYQGWGVETETLSTSVSATYHPKNRDYSFDFYASHDSEQTPEWWIDTNYFYSQASVKWDLWDKQGSKSFLALTFGYSRYEDEIYSGSNSDDFSVKISFKSYSLDRVLNGRNASPYRNNQRISYRTYQQDLWFEREREYLALQSTPEPEIGRYHSAAQMRGFSSHLALQSAEPTDWQMEPATESFRNMRHNAQQASQQKDAQQWPNADKGQWFVNFGSYYNLFNAEELQEQLIPSFSKVDITKVPIDGGTLYRVRIIGIETRQEADELARQYEETSGQAKTWVGRS
jgi:SPOR domain